ncbi:DUF1489 family protein [Roseomonas elaeocarpi]|uniref:DUF1489 family protein n=1 Tax=Roseomonas elaeocarpi TaxID=907779 RepID=A0ABV6JWQ5_9PROT
MAGVALNLIKLSVGPKDVHELRRLQAERLVVQPPLRHWTRMIPRRREELLDGGSIYWVIGGFVRVRQKLLDLVEDQDTEGRARVALVLDPELVPVELRPQKPFQGWRYLTAVDAPGDVGDGPVASGLETIPPKLRVELRRLGLL